MLVPAMASMGMRSSSMTFKTPTWAAPRAPPPLNTRPMRGRCGSSAAAIAGIAKGKASSSADAQRNAKDAKWAFIFEIIVPAVLGRSPNGAQRMDAPDLLVTLHARRYAFQMTATCRRLATPVLIGLAIAAGASAAPPHRHLNDDDAQWQWYGGDAGGTRRSSQARITRDNVERLEIAWTYRTGDVGAMLVQARKMSFEATPILIDETLYLSTPTNIVVAIEAATGKPRWRYDPKISRKTR